MMMPAISSSTAFSQRVEVALLDLLKPGTSGAKPARTAGLPVAAIIASVRPWKLLVSEMIFHLLRFASIRAAAPA
jgi:hypothetical protein